MNGMKGFNVTQAKLLWKPEADGTNLIGQVYIPNPSPMTIEMVRLPF
jgi:hypothetical protein